MWHKFYDLSLYKRLTRETLSELNLQECFLVKDKEVNKWYKKRKDLYRLYDPCNRKQYVVPHNLRNYVQSIKTSINTWLQLDKDKYIFIDRNIKYVQIINFKDVKIEQLDLSKLDQSMIKQIQFYLDH